MDPDAALQALIDALIGGDLAAAREHFADLDSWLFRGGFRPSPVAATRPCARCGWNHPYEP